MQPSLPNKQALCFDNVDEYSRYMAFGDEPQNYKIGGVVRLDFAYYTPRETYLIEVKTVSKKFTGYHKLIIERRLTIASHFVRKNFKDQITLIGIIYSEKDEKLLYEHYKFNSVNSI
jgi:hypothetical protein